MEIHSKTGYKLKQTLSISLYPFAYRSDPPFGSFVVLTEKEHCMQRSFSLNFSIKQTDIATETENGSPLSSFIVWTWT